MERFIAFNAKTESGTMVMTEVEGISDLFGTSIIMYKITEPIIWHIN